MLSPREIAELEKKYSKYIWKKIFKISIYILIVLLVFTFIAYFFIFKKTSSRHTLDRIEKNTTVIEKNQENPYINKTDLNASIKIKEIDPNLIKTDTNHTEEENSTDKNITTNNIKNIIKSNDIDENKTSNKQKLLLEDNESEKNFKFKLHPSNTVYANHENTGRLNFHFKLKKIIYRKKSQIKPTLLQNANENGIITENKNKKTKIDIEISDINSVQYLKDKLQKTHDISFALMLCRNYYLKKDFKNSLKWSIIANDMDSQNAKSWIWFAKSKYKLNKREDAIKALRAFLKTNDSEEVRSLLHNIVNGELND